MGSFGRLSWLAKVRPGDGVVGWKVVPGEGISRRVVQGIDGGGGDGLFTSRAAHLIGAADLREKGPIGNTVKQPM